MRTYNPRKRILVTGGAGFLGVNSARHFADKGWEVTVLDNLSRRGTEDNLRWLQDKSPIKFERADIRDADAMERIVGKVKPDALLHLGGRQQGIVCVAEVGAAPAPR